METLRSFLDAILIYLFHFRVRVLAVVNEMRFYSRPVHQTKRNCWAPKTSVFLVSGKASGCKVLSPEQIQSPPLTLCALFRDYGKE